MIVRFLGDPIGYRLSESTALFVQENLGSVQWTRAYVGRSDRLVWIDLSKAYRIGDSE